MDILGRTWTYTKQKLYEFVYELGLFLKLQPVAQNCARVAHVIFGILAISLRHFPKVSEVSDKPRICGLTTPPALKKAEVH